MPTFARKTGMKTSAKLSCACSSPMISRVRPPFWLNLSPNAAMRWSELPESGLEAIQAYERPPTGRCLDGLSNVKAEWRHRLSSDPGEESTRPHHSCERMLRRRRGKEVGAIAILIKPVKLHRLYEALHTAAHGDPNFPKNAQSEP